MTPVLLCVCFFCQKSVSRHPSVERRRCRHQLHRQLLRLPHPQFTVPTHAVCHANETPCQHQHRRVHLQRRNHFRSTFHSKHFRFCVFLIESQGLLLLLLLKRCFTSTETVGLLGTGAQDGHLDFHTAPELCSTMLT